MLTIYANVTSGLGLWRWLGSLWLGSLVLYTDGSNTSCSFFLKTFFLETCLGDREEESAFKAVLFTVLADGRFDIRKHIAPESQCKINERRR